MPPVNSHSIWNCTNMNTIRNLSWKQKNRLLLAGLLVTIWIIYAFAISNTLEARTACNTLQSQIDSASGAPARITELEYELKRLDAVSGSTHNAPTDSAVHEQLLSLVTEYCENNDLILREFVSPVKYTQQEWIVETHPFTVEGNFAGIVQLLDYLRKNVPGKIVSADIRTKKDNRTKTTSLLVTVYVQNISTPST